MIRFIIVLLALYLVARIFRVFVVPFFRGYNSGTNQTHTQTTVKKKQYRGEIVDASFEDITDKKNSVNEKKSDNA